MNSIEIYQLTLRLREIKERRSEAFMSAMKNKEAIPSVREVVGDVTTQEDIDVLNVAFSALDEFSQLVCSIREDVWAEFRQGIRCSVCGRTSKQNAAIGYDCIREC